MKFKNIIYYTSLALISIFFLYLQGFLWLLQLAIFFIFYWSLIYLFHLAWTYFRKKEKIKYPKYIIEFSKKMSLWFIIAAIILWSIAYYENEVSPAKMPTFTITNGEKTVIFQAMSHIWTTEFYEKIKQDLIKAKKDWYVYFFEWVKPWTPTNSEKFNQALWVEFDKDLYPNLSKLYGVTNQDNSIYYWLVNNLDFNVDVDIDYIMENYEKKLSSFTWELNSINQDSIPIDINSQIIKTLSELNPKELKMLVYINQAILNFIIKSKETQDLIASNFSNQVLFDIILNWRNKVLSDAIIDSEYDKIYVTYGLLHFEWVLKLLQIDDKNWKIIDTSYLIPIQ